MIFFEQADALLREWLTSPTWHVDKPSENAKFYRFAAALMQEAGQPDIREVRGTLEEAAREWAAGYEERGGDRRIDVLCERLQVLYDFANALQEPSAVSTTSPSLGVPPSPPTSVPLPLAPVTTPTKRSVPPSAERLVPIVQEPILPPPSLPVTEDSTVPIAVREAAATAQPHQAAPPPELPPVPKKRGRRGKEVRIEPSVESKDGPSSERMQAFWRVVLELYDVLVVRRGETPPTPPPPNDAEAIAAEMQRRAHEVLHAEEITGAEKNRLIRTIIDKVIPHRKDGDAVYVEIEWLK